MANPKEAKLNIYNESPEAPHVRKHREFVDSVTSDATKNCDTFIERLDELQDGDPKWSQNKG